MAGNYLKSLQLAKQLEERAREATRNRELAEKENEALEGFLKECKENDIDLSDVQKELSKYGSSMDIKDYQSALGHARKASEAARSAYMAKAREVIESVELLQSYVQGTGNESRPAADLLEKSKDLLTRDDLEAGMKAAKDAYNAAERAVHEHLSEMFSHAQEVLIQAKDMGEDVTIFDDLLSRAKSSLEKQDYETSITHIREALEGAGENLRNQTVAAIGRAEELVSAGEELGAETTRVRSYIERAKGMLDSLKFKESLAYAKRAETEADNVISARFQEMIRTTRESIRKVKTVRDDVTIPQQLLDQAQNAIKEKKYIEASHALSLAKERTDQMQFQVVLEVIAKARDRFVLAKKVGVDLTKPIMLLNTARDNLKSGKFEESLHYAEESRKVVDEALDVFYKARDQIAQLGEAIKFAAELGADITSLKHFITDARKHFEAREYERTANTANEGLSMARKLAYDAAMIAIDTSDKAVKLAKKIGADVTEAEGVLQRALESLSKEDMRESVNLARDSNEAANSAMTRILSDRIQSIDQFVKGYAGGAAPDDVNDLIMRARQHVAAFEFDGANQLLVEVTQKIEKSGEEEAARLLETARESIKLMASMGTDTSDLELLLKRAEEATAQKVYQDAAARANEIIQTVNEHVVTVVQAEFSAMKDTLEESRAIGIDIEEAKTQLMKARELLNSKEYVEAHEIVRSVRANLQGRITRHDGIKDKIRMAEELIAEAERSKADVAKSQRKLDTAKLEFERGNYDQAESLLDECTSEAEKTLAMYLAAKFILTSKESMDFAQSNGIEVTASSELLGRAKQLMKEKKYEEALAKAKKCEEETKKTISVAITGMIKDLQRLLSDARNVGVDTIGPQKLAVKAVELAKSNDYIEALKCIASAKDDIEQVKNLSSQAALEIKTARNNLKNAETLGMEVAQSRELLEQAIDALTRHQYAIALELARKSSETSIEISKARIKETLEEFRQRVDKAASEGAPLGLAESCVADGMAAFNEGKYETALRLVMKCESELERAELQRSISSRSVEMARRRLNEATAEGIRNDRLIEFVTAAEKHLREGKYSEALSAAIESGDELVKIRDGMDAVRIDFSTVLERVERLKKINIDTSECDEILEMAQDYLASHDLARCKDALRRCSQTAAALFENSIRDVLERDKRMISSAKAMGINTKPCEDLLEVANTSFSEKLWDFAYQQALSCKDKCLELIAKKISGLIDDVRTRMSCLKQSGASVDVIEEQIEEARQAGASGDIEKAFRILMDVDNRVALVEDGHKKYIDISLAAESAIENLGRFGLSKKEAERLLAMAEIEREKDYDSAIELVAEALDTAANLIDTYSPEIGGAVSATDLQEGVEGDLTITLKNTGKALAKDVTVEVEGDLETKGAAVIPALRPNSQETVKVHLVPSRRGNIPIRVRISSRRYFDGKEVSSELEDSVKVFARGPPFKLSRATEANRCASCQGRIKPGFDIVSCRCGNQLHLACAKRVGKCPSCGQKFSF